MHPVLSCFVILERDLRNGSPLSADTILNLAREGARETLREEGSFLVLELFLLVPNVQLPVSGFLAMVSQWVLLQVISQ